MLPVEKRAVLKLWFGKEDQGSLVYVEQGGFEMEMFVLAVLCLGKAVRNFCKAGSVKKGSCWGIGWVRLLLDGRCWISHNLHR